jgi:hypothetical protein
MATVKGANVTKFEALEAGGVSGDNYISDGLIKSVEKLWIDEYVMSTALATTSSILIARIPKGKKITNIKVYLPIISDPGTACTVYCCTGASTSVTTYFGALKGSTKVTAVDGGTASTVTLEPSKALQELASDTGIYIMVDVEVTVTGGTIRSIVKYT